jgi:hypothetical protein
MSDPVFILHPTPTAQWQALVYEAQHHCAIILTEELESYLVFLLMRFATHPELANSMMALDFLQGLNELGTHRDTKLRNVGDKCLLLSGLFPAHIQKRQLTLNYFIHLGQTAYDSIFQSPAEEHYSLFKALSQNFSPLRDVVQALTELPSTELNFIPNTAAHPPTSITTMSNPKSSLNKRRH